MGLSAASRKAAEQIESEMARKGFNLADIIEEAVSGSILVFESDAGAGGGATEAMTVTGLLATDTILSVTQRVAGANSLAPIGYSAQVNDGLTMAWAADPGAGAVVRVAVRRV